MRLSISNIRRKLRLMFRYIRHDGKITNLSIAKIQKGHILQDKRIIITGGTSLIGLAMAIKFLEEGAVVLLTGRNKAKLTHIEKEFNNPRLKILVWDVCDYRNIEKLFTESIKLLGGLDFVINNAAFLAHKQTDQEFYDITLDTNLKAVYFICQEAVKRISALNGLNGGKILNISSINGQMSSTHPYYISKWGLNGLTRGYAKEYAAKNIIVNAIAPGYCSSGMNTKDIENNAYSEKNPIHRMIVPEEIAELATFLLSDASNGIIGQTIVIDGGTTL